MSLLALVGIVAVVTVGSRILALAVLPAPSGRLAGVVDRLPAPLFAGLAAVTLLGAEAGPTDPPLLAAVLCALVSTRWRSLLVTLVAGLSGYLLAGLLL
jgi:branched-subunit amino acid transport protein